MKPISDEEKSAAATLSDMEIFIFPELMYSLVLANVLSPRLWRWRELDWFAGIREMRPKKRLQRLRQHVMDNYTFNLDLETWGLTTQARELARFAPFLSPDEIARSNALFGYHGDAYYYDIDIRRHFGLDKYTSDVIPYWKTETIEAMDAFRRKPGHAVGAGECVSLAGLYAAAAFVVCGLPLESIYLMATPLHSQNFLDVDTGILTNNRRLVTRAMWSNGTVISQQARRALEHERVTIVSHATGYIHLLYPEATIDPAAYARFAERLDAFLVPPEDAADQRRVTPRLPGAARVSFRHDDAPLDLTPEMDYAEISDRLRALRATNRTAALAPYAGHELGETESAPFVKAALERSPVSKAALDAADVPSVLSRLAALDDESIYDGPSRLAQPDEVWNYGTGDGLEKCLLAANVLGGTEIRVANGVAALMDGERAVCAFPTAKRPRDAVWPLAAYSSSQASTRPESDTCR
ncbi:MAG: hypothetical protein IJI36_10815 [Kiritimatiellae bacterium]|nr:hypothetical protein [Kiritimatiellia bacterium]